MSKELTSLTDLTNTDSQTAPTSLDWDAATIHLKNVEAQLLTYAGKKDHNPYIMIRELGIPDMKKQLAKKDYSEKLHAQIMALKLDNVPHAQNLKSLPIPYDND